LTEGSDRCILRISRNVAHEPVFQPDSSTDSGTALHADDAPTQVHHANFSVEEDFTIIYSIPRLKWVVPKSFRHVGLIATFLGTNFRSCSLVWHV